MMAGPKRTQILTKSEISFVDLQNIVCVCCRDVQAGESQNVDRPGEKLQKPDDQSLHDMMQLNDQHVGDPAVGVQVEGTADSMQHLLDIMLCNHDRQSQQQRESQWQPATATATAIGIQIQFLFEISCDHESPRDQIFVNRKRQYQPLPAALATADLDRKRQHQPLAAATTAAATATTACRSAREEDATLPRSASTPRF